jgi:hypothetical protein
VGKGKSRFDGLMEAKRRGRDEGSPESLREPSDPPPRPQGAGKRGDPDYRQVSAYVRKDTHQKVKMALLEEEREFSELVEVLLREWLNKRT